MRTRQDLQWLSTGAWRGDADGDFGRMLRQHMFGRLLLLPSATSVEIPGKRALLLDLFADFVTMDQLLDPRAARGARRPRRQLGPDDVSSRNFPVVPMRPVDGAQVLLPDRGAGRR